jgi:hypothetical protein
MEILAEKNKSDINSQSPFSTAMHTTPDIVERMIGFLTLTEEDRLRAGIYIGSEGREWIDRSALILPLCKPD